MGRDSPIALPRPECDRTPGRAPCRSRRDRGDLRDAGLCPSSTAAELRTEFEVRSSGGRGPAAVTTAVGVRALGAYDTSFGLSSREPTSFVSPPVAP